MCSQRQLYEDMCDRDAKLYKLEEVSGHTIDELITLFAVGFELTPKCMVGKCMVGKSILACSKCGGSGFVQSGPDNLGIKRCPVCNPANHINWRNSLQGK